MPLQSIFTAGRNDDTSLNTASFGVIVLAIIWGWLLVSVTLRVVENLSFQTFGMNSRSTVHALVIAIVMILLFLAFVWMVDSYQIIPASAAATSLGEATGGLLAASADDAAERTIEAQLGSNRHGHPIVITPVSYY
jgi:hypothetical protein